jgi:KaiC/GvpD/RAD55 family RecA-like ATPase
MMEIEIVPPISSLLKFKEGSFVLLVGGPGTGKTIFCIQSLYEFAKSGKRVVYLSPEIFGRKTLEAYEKMFPELKSLIEKTFYVAEFEVKEPQDLINDLYYVLNTFSPRIIAIDPTTPLKTFDREIVKTLLYDIYELLKTYKRLGFITIELSENKLPFDVEHLFADYIIFLEKRMIENNIQRTLTINSKHHFSPVTLNFQITNKGILFDVLAQKRSML